MAELATLARPYAEAMFKATAGADRKALSEQLATLVALTSGPEMRQYADIGVQEMHVMPPAGDPVGFVRALGEHVVSRLHEL